MQRFLTPLIVCAATGLAVGCATPANDTASTENAAVESADENSETVCLRNSSISGFTAIDERHILVTAPTRSKTYMITTMGRCMNLDHTHQLVIDSGPMSCVTKFDRIKFRDSAAFPETCPIKSIDKVADKEAALALIAERAGENASEVEDKESED